MQQDLTRVYDVVDNFCIHKDVRSIPVKQSDISIKPTYTIVIPTYKRSNLLKESIDSALAQNDDIAYDILILDNNPEFGDETEKCINENYNNSQRIAYYKNSSNLGMTGNWNRMFELAIGEWVIMLHDDDILFPNALNIINKMIQNEPDVDTIFLTTTKLKDFSYTNSGVAKYINLKAFDFMMGNCGEVVGTVFRKSKVIELGGFNDTYYPSEDYHFWAMLAIKAHVIKIINPILGYYRIGENESLKISVLKGFLEKDEIIKMGISQQYKHSIISLFYKYYMRQSRLAKVVGWGEVFGGVYSKEYIALINELKNQSNCITKAIFIIYSKCYKLYKGIRDTFLCKKLIVK